MPDIDPATPRRLLRAAHLTAGVAVLAMLAACASSQPKSMARSKSTEYFAESEYGVKASPRMTSKRSRLPRGGGRDQIGKPYKVKGKWYYPQEDPDYVKVGAASWYGDAFHGRLTANGEIYDMTHLTAAHPTMPLPSYARVTNTANGSSVIVRVNDRGPFARGRIIDLSKRAAELLDYTSAGVAKVEVEYLGRAPLHGRDDQFLMASYRPGGRGPADGPSHEAAPSVMIAMNGPTPVAGVGATAISFPGQPQSASGAEPVLPAFGPIGPERPTFDAVVFADMSESLPPLSYADERIASASKAFAALSPEGLQAAEAIAAWKRRDDPHTGYIAAGAFSSRDEAEQHVRALSKVGRVALETAVSGGAIWHIIDLHPDGRNSLDHMLRAAWAAGASEAIAVRD